MKLIQLTNSTTDFSQVDDIYFEEVCKHNWYLTTSKSGRKIVSTTINTKRYELSVFIAILSKIPNPYPDRIVDLDHINDNSLNNQVGNLRYIPNTENIRRGHKNPYKCIRERENKYNPFEVTVYIKNKPHYLGCFRTLEEALHARNLFAQEYNLILY